MRKRSIHPTSYLAAVALLWAACSSGNKSPPAASESLSSANQPAAAEPAEPAAPAAAPTAATPTPTLSPVSDKSTKARLLVGTLAPGDPLRVAIRWGDQRLNTVAILRTLTATLTGPGGTQTLRPDPSALNNAGWSEHTAVIELSGAGMTEKFTGLSMPWSGPVPDWRTPGAYQLTLSGNTGTREFHIPPLTVVVSGARPALAELEKIARAELEARVPAVVSKPKSLLKRTESGFVHGVAIEVEPGKLRFRYAVMEKFRWGYDLHSITVGVDRSIANMARKSINTCIASGVKLDGEHGARAIETIAIGDRIWGYDFERRQRVLVTVRDIRVSQADAVLQIGALRVTGNHPVFVDGQWQAASAVRPGAAMLASNGTDVTVARVSHIGRSHTVYNLTVDGPHNYFAGGLLVHNKDRGYFAALDDPWLFMWSDDPGR